jgi:hypothetical protein
MGAGRRFCDAFILNKNSATIRRLTSTYQTPWYFVVYGRVAYYGTILGPKGLEY